ncbi:MAG: cyclic nucleotide-binding domain-containing protein [Nitriliruptorales bacterium]|nr:cyclic nucleotide-binding domain-containing protein [Nitriliruptorales bacterium]
MKLLGRRKHDGKTEWLGSQPWWSDLDDDDLAALAGTGDRASVPAGTTIMTEGRRGYESAVIVAGEVEVIHDGEILATLGPGEVIGELSLLDHRPRTADVRSRTDVDLLVFSVRGLQRAMSASASVRRQVQEAAEQHRS